MRYTQKTRAALPALIDEDTSRNELMTTNPDAHDQHAFSAGEMITASELREFVYCERAWFLSRHGYAVSAKAEEHRAAGVAFHAERAGAARSGTSNQAVWWAILLILAAIALWLARSFTELHS